MSLPIETTTFDGQDHLPNDYIEVSIEPTFVSRYVADGTHIITDDGRIMPSEAVSKGVLSLIRLPKFIGRKKPELRRAITSIDEAKGNLAGICEIQTTEEYVMTPDGEDVVTVTPVLAPVRPISPQHVFREDDDLKRLKPIKPSKWREDQKKVITPERVAQITGDLTFIPTNLFEERIWEAVNAYDQSVISREGYEEANAVLFEYLRKNGVDYPFMMNDLRRALNVLQYRQNTANLKRLVEQKRKANEDAGIVPPKQYHEKQSPQLRVNGRRYNFLQAFFYRDTQFPGIPQHTSVIHRIESYFKAIFRIGRKKRQKPIVLGGNHAKVIDGEKLLSDKAIFREAGVWKFRYAEQNPDITDQARIVTMVLFDESHSGLHKERLDVKPIRRALTVEELAEIPASVVVRTVNNSIGYTTYDTSMIPGGEFTLNKGVSHGVRSLIYSHYKGEAGYTYVHEPRTLNVVSSLEDQVLGDGRNVRILDVVTRPVILPEPVQEATEEKVVQEPKSFEEIELDAIDYRYLSLFFSTHLNMQITEDQAKSIIKKMREKVYSKAYQKIIDEGGQVALDELDYFVHLEMLSRLERLTKNISESGRDLRDWTRAERGAQKHVAKRIVEQNIFVAVIAKISAFEKEHGYSKRILTRKDLVELLILGERKIHNPSTFIAADYRTAIDGVIQRYQAVRSTNGDTDEIDNQDEDQGNDETRIIHLNPRPRLRHLIASALASFAIMFRAN